MNILSMVTGKQLKDEEMIKLDMHLVPPVSNGDWRTMLFLVKAKRDALEKKAKKLEQNKGVYIRPIALIQVERTGKDQRGQGFVHSEDVRELLVASGVAAHEIAVKSASLDEIKQQKLLSKENEIRYIITKEALKEGWDCSFAYILGVIPNARTNASMTQLVGRVLRQPYAKKTGISELDESYIFFTSGHTQEVLDNVKKGFEDEGLGDVVPGIEIQDQQGNVLNPPKIVGIKKEIKKRYPESLLLPMWLIKGQKRSLRKFSYDTDIRPRLSWRVLPEIRKWLDELASTIGERRERTVEIIIGLEGAMAERQTESQTSIIFDELYLTRRMAETVGNAFIAREMARIIVSTLQKKFDARVLDQNAGSIAREMEKKLVAHRKAQEQTIFEELIKNSELEMVVSDDDRIGFAMPDKDVVANSVQSAYSLNLYEDVEQGSMNSLEQEVARIIEESGTNVIWWARNKAQKGWYALQGWRRDKIRPDFVIARRNENNWLEFVYVVESKGEQLAGNDDTEYKKTVMDKMSSMRGSVEQVRVKTTTVRMNDQFQFELIPQGQEETRLRTVLQGRLPF